MSLFEKVLMGQIGAPALGVWLGSGGWTYTPQAGTPTTGLTIQIERDEPLQVDSGLRSAGEMQHGRIAVTGSQLSNPQIGGRFSIKSGAEVSVWTIKTTPVYANGQYYCTVERGGVERHMDARAKQ